MKVLPWLILLILLVFPVTTDTSLLNAQTDINKLEEGFRNPPDEAKPRTWWHWTNSNITIEGITKDLEWMKRAGIGGMQLADVASGSGQTVEKKILFGSEEWLKAVKHSASEADRLGLEMTIFSSPGWSLTGGPWVKPEQAMKKLVWSETIVSGPAEYKAKLSDPPSIEGPIRNLSRNTKVLDSDPRFYRDFKVLAFRTPVDELAESQLRPVITTSGGTIEPDALLDDDLNSSVTIRSGKDKKIVWLEYDFGSQITIRSLTMANRAGIPVGKLLAGKDNNSYSIVAVLPGAQLYRAGKVETITFPEVKARFFRLEFTGAPMKPADVMAETQTLPDSVYTFGEIKFHSAARVNRWEDKAGFYHLFSYDPVESVEAPASSVISPSEVVDITSMMSSDGTLQWKVPAGKWTVMRFGYSLTGSKNRPAVPSGSGYEVDKLSREHSEEYIKAYTDPIAASLGQLYGKSLRYVLLDSWEAGMQNWTEKMTEEFSKRRGYDLTPFLPSLAGYIVGSSEISDRVLWDFRRTLADMFAENHYAVITDYLHKQGIRTYGEASGVSLEILEDALLCKKYVDIPMGEFWYRALHPELMYYQDVRGAASAAHIGGKNIVAAESFTGGGFESPYTLKKIGDYWFTQGINRFIFHTSAHQPLDTRPGNTMVGTHINRNITWAEQAEPFMQYLSRNSYMLQQGKSVADLVYLIDEGAPSTMPIWGTGLIPAPPEGYDYDYINADALVNEMKVDESGHMVLPGGAEYSVLVLPQTVKMTLPVLRKIKDLVEGGAKVLGPKPLRTPGYSAYPASEKELSDLVKELWGDIDGISRTRRYYGKGIVYWGTPVKSVLESEKVAPDIEYDRQLNTKIDWIHRRTVDAEIYFVVNSSDVPLNTRIRFRVSGKEAWLWDPVAGTTRPAQYTISGNSTVVEMSFGERESLFVVFRDKKDVFQTPANNAVQFSELLLTGPWELRFPENLGAPALITIDTLKSWTQFKDEGVKFFSGTATYSKSVVVNKSFLNGSTKIIIDLGAVADIAEVSVNGKKAKLCWSPPYQAEITGMLIPGKNTIEINVTNEWTNRLAGDMKLPAGQKILNSSLFVRPGLLSMSGLMGPVRLIMYK